MGPDEIINKMKELITIYNFFCVYIYIYIYIYKEKKET